MAATFNSGPESEVANDQLDFDMDLINSIVKLATEEDQEEEEELSTIDDLLQSGRNMARNNEVADEVAMVATGSQDVWQPMVEAKTEQSASQSQSPSSTELTTLENEDTHSAPSPKSTEGTSTGDECEDDCEVEQISKEDGKRSKEDAKPSYFQELFPKLDFDKNGWLKRWPTFGSGKNSLLHPEIEAEHAKVTHQYLFNLKFYEFDAKNGNFVNRDLRYQDSVQRKCETDSGLFDQKMYMDYYGKTSSRGRVNLFGRDRAAAERHYNPEFAATYSAYKRNHNPEVSASSYKRHHNPEVSSPYSRPQVAPVKPLDPYHGLNRVSQSAPTCLSDMEWIEKNIPRTRDQEKTPVNLNQLQHAVNIYLGGTGVTKKPEPNQSQRQMFKPLPPSPLPRFNN